LVLQPDSTPLKKQVSGTWEELEHPKTKPLPRIAHTDTFTFHCRRLLDEE
jgi:hypothetical protein